MRLHWTLAAARDLESVQDYISRDDPVAAVGTVVKIIRRVRILVDHPVSVGPDA